MVELVLYVKVLLGHTVSSEQPRLSLLLHHFSSVHRCESSSLKTLKSPTHLSAMHHHGRGVRVYTLSLRYPVAHRSAVILHMLGLSIFRITFGVVEYHRRILLFYTAGG